ncbi:DUF4845 domain-containing protein [Legionella taurinensis]|uniref:DUF4845 domain-containing protein n=1 Tax=Legionella taurinensis TaxID=70611 RepID=A0A3A5LC41_9GAMM|nr:DUF4845 domain-containing protein [Legionella taurinensis]MDX1837328.1 DUF4845 domain-containing protein [Legionella taurinensis]PUT40683.1 DUF4845 domain-containing protein [Legionella taurinensis]PUT44105.1 DUF4845 domain-containing protein [Legionella taurinensis]PUT47406.1 DUF4845 domain-containing protein [Legionella taurinensis]PUT48545.1 DUF4845 domain-containing protein [Legionella taurinensis]
MRNQQGLTLIGMLFTVIVVCIAGLVIMRVVPVYIQHFEVKRSISALENIEAAEFSTDTAANAMVLRKRLANQFTINGLDDIKLDEVNIVPDGQGNFNINVKYTVVRPLFYNISLMFNFDETKEVNIGKK